MAQRRVSRFSSTTGFPYDGRQPNCHLEEPRWPELSVHDRNQPRHHYEHDAHPEVLRRYLHDPPLPRVRSLLLQKRKINVLTKARCWDGVNLDSPDHQSHMYNTVRSEGFDNAPACPSTHPVRVPQV